MVTVGFIAEGDSEAILLKDSSFINFLASINIHCDSQLVINAGGKNHLYHPKGDFSLLERKVKGWIETLIAKGAAIIFFLIDFDNSDPCFTQFKSKVYHYKENKIIIAKQALEAWYLADNKSLSAYMQQKILQIQEPESYLSPFDEIKRLKLLHQNRGINDKKILTINILKSGFSLLLAAAHPQCLSAQYFLAKLKEVSTNK